MESFKELVQQRRSHRKFTQESVSEEDLKTILRAGLMAPTGKGLRKWRFVVTTNPERISKLGGIRPMGSQFVAGAPAVIAILGEKAEHDTWVEDCSIAAVTLQYQIQDLGLGSCWCQVRGRESAEEGISAEQKVREILGIEERYSVLCLIALGHPCDERKPQDEASLKWEQVDYAD